MEQIITSIILAFLTIVEIVLYFALSSMAFYRIVRVKCSLNGSSDRGLQKYTYPDGRGVSYEPHPSIRKYIQRYILFTSNGYKFFKCRLDTEVKHTDFSVIMFNNKNRVIDVLDVKVTNNLGNESKMLQLHKDTSYVSVVLDSVNGMAIEHPKTFECKVWKLLAYVFAASMLNFLQLLFIRWVIDVYDGWYFYSGITRVLPTYKLFFVALLIGILAGAIIFLRYRAKKVRWSI